MENADDRRFMARAVELSRRHTGLTGTNPSVGCVIVKDGRIVGEAVTARGGRPHAETQALAAAGELAKGATAYVTLEPCSHHGRTPPCANALVAAGIARVVVSLTDPDPRVSGRGLNILREAGIDVVNGLMAEEGGRVLAAYLTRQTKGRPHVTLKLAVSADGMIGRKGEEVAITGAEARAEVHRERVLTDAILVGIGTVLADDPELTVRLPGLEERSPIRIVLDRRLRMPLDSKLVRTAKQVPVIVVTEGGRLAALEEAGVEIIGTADLDGLLAMLAKRGISSLIVEGGAAVARSFLDLELVDRILIFQGTGVVGPDGLASPLLPSDMPPEFKLLRDEMFGPDRLFEYERGF